MDEDKKKEELAKEVLKFSRQRILVNMRFLESAMAALTEVPGNIPNGTSSYGISSDGRSIYYNPEYILQAYMKEKNSVSRIYLHLLLHGIFRHFYVNPKICHARWNLACDMAVEYIIGSWNLDFAYAGYEQDEKRELENIKKKSGLMNAEKIYSYLKNQDAAEISRLEKIFRRDDHDVWYQDNQMKSEQKVYGSATQQELDEKWRQIAQKIQVDLETFMRKRSGEAGDFLVNLKLANRKKQNYQEFLQKFSRLGEHMKINDEEFDYNFYTYGMQLYGNMPLIEPLEYQDVRAVRTFAVVIDTSGSVEPEKLRRFLEKTYQILVGQKNLSEKVNYHLIQCDAKVQTDVKITSQDELERYMDNLVIYGRGGTDFRPAFEYVDELRKNGELANLNGVLYFTDGMGIYPAKQPDYPTAFIFDSESLEKLPKVPAWAIRYLMDDI